MALQQSPEIGKYIDVFVERVGKDGGAAGKAFFRYQIIVAQFLLQQTGSAHVFVESDAAVGAIVGIRAISVGVGIADT